MTADNVRNIVGIGEAVRRLGLPDCEVDGEEEDKYGGYLYWHCGEQAVGRVGGLWRCTKHYDEFEDQR